MIDGQTDRNNVIMVGPVPGPWTVVRQTSGVYHILLETLKSLLAKVTIIFISRVWTMFVS